MSINQIFISKMVLIEIKNKHKITECCLIHMEKTKHKRNADHFLFEKEQEEAKLVNSYPCLHHVTFAARMKIQYMNCYKHQLNRRTFKKLNSLIFFSH